MRTRIICIGNRLVTADALGPLVRDRLGESPLPPDVEVLDGGLQGLNLLAVVDGAERVVFVDALSGFAPPGEVVVLSAAEAACEERAEFGHAAGLGYLIRAMPLACDRPPSSVALVGAEGSPTERLVHEVAARALELATGAAR